MLNQNQNVGRARKARAFKDQACYLGLDVGVEACQIKMFRDSGT